jgi:hypothetical protein
MTQVIHCRTCSGTGHVSKGVGYDTEISVVCLACRGTGMMEVSPEQILEWDKEQAEHLAQVRARAAAESAKARKLDLTVFWFIVGLCAILGLFASHPLIGMAIGLSLACWFWFAN